MTTNSNARRQFLKTAALGAAGIAMGGIRMNAASYARVKGSNDRINVAIIGLGRRLGAYPDPIRRAENNVRLLYLCDVMQSQREKAGARFSRHLDYVPTLEENYFRVLEDKNVDAVIIAMPDHWHAPGALLATAAGKHVYLEKPGSHNPYEGELLVKAQQKHGNVIQLGNQQRSAPESIEIINEIHNGVIGTPYLAKAFYSNNRGRVINPVQAPVPAGLNWELWQGPAPRKNYEHDTWDYNWHWYGWDYGTAETGNNALHEYDIARWALQVDFPEKVIVDADKYHWKNDGWTMYDTMDATFKYPGGKTIKWDCKSRNSHETYGSGRGTVIYGTEGSVYIDRDGYKLFDRDGKLTRENYLPGREGGTQLGGGGDMSTLHVENFFDAIRGKADQKSPIDIGVKSMLMCHLSNIAYRTGEVLECNPANGLITNSENAMKLWRRDYEKGWEPVV